ncbi:tetratricopeptide repeat protein [Tichowtungia aerotolerans]|uniref:Sel1 repeat family protein n=1 Tax=Tichowtungia aerotolerans TaxID=2697043 RepID=A0A6P1M5D2_9BACT|nr:tetratricopeptide repeat protein [Tichowtungia aerotolerans]QHI68203.1 hypothetical protein GT409_01635 [Tichowtungia aerotolerans]
MVNRFFFKYVLGCLLFSFGTSFASPNSSVEDCLVSGSAAQKYELAVRWLHRPELCLDSSDPVELLQSASKEGHIMATVRLGSLYLSGSGVERSTKEAFGLYRKAIAAFLFRMLLKPAFWVFSVVLAAVIVLKSLCCILRNRGWLVCKMAGSGDPIALYKAALRYKTGRGVLKERARALNMLMQSAESGFSPAQVEVGHYYRDGIIVQQNRVKAAEWYLKAADQGESGGLYFAGQCYESGAGVPSFLPKAYGFYMLAAARGHRSAGAQADGLLTRMTKMQVKQGLHFARNHAEEKGFDWFSG